MNYRCEKAYSYMNLSISSSKNDKLKDLFVNSGSIFWSISKTQISLNSKILYSNT